MPKVWANLKFMIMKKIAVIALFSIIAFGCTTDDQDTNVENNHFETRADSTPPTHDKDWGKDEKPIKID